MHLARYFLGAGWGLIVGLCAALGTEPAQAPPPRAVPPVELIHRLGNEDYHKREEAMRQLAGLNLTVPPPELLLATKSSNPEVSWRAALVVRAIGSRVAGQRLEPILKFISRGEVDRFVAGTGDPAFRAGEDRLWAAAFELVQAVSKQSDRRLWRSPPDFAQFRATQKPGFIFTSETWPRADPGQGGQPRAGRAEVVLARDVKAGQGIHSCAIIARGPIRARGTLSHSFTFANGPVAVGGDTRLAFIISDGDVEVSGGVEDSIIVARGTVKCDYSHSSALVAGGRVVVVNKFSNTPRAGNLIREQESKPFGRITFFELAHVGIEVAAADGGARVAGLTASKPFAAAGVQKDDIITKVGTYPVASADELRGRIRDASVTAGEAELTVRRGGRTLNVRVPLPD